MGFTRAVPATAEELREKLEALYENIKHVDSATVNHAESRIEVDLSGKANFFGNPDFYIPVKKARLSEAADLIERLMSDARGGTDKPSEASVDQLFEMIDQNSAGAAG